MINKKSRYLRVREDPAFLHNKINEEFFTTEYCCPLDSLEFHGGIKARGLPPPCNSRLSNGQQSSVVNSYFLEWEIICC